ncbi:hypothetical protein ETD83_40310 [Actinomadura soli]|uniref:Uncharacterized protein n=2 Tax=Actinomadura soli TaxID=2508997 RepID=A0A5C4J008_9ACTN|nr:hypothetical protein ETD83_40310 [Actinomadura soli]
MMNTPHVPGDKSGQVNTSGETTGRAAGKAVGTARRATGGAAQGVRQGVRKSADQAGGQVAALPGRVAGLARLVTLARFLRAAPIAAAAVAGVVVGRRTARRR